MKSRTLLALLAAALILPGCSRDAQDGKGRLRIASFSADAKLNNASVTRTTESLEGLTPPAAEEFSLKLETDDGTLIGTWADLTEYPGQGYSLDPGAYTATAFYGDIEQEGFGHPCFGVTEPFNIFHDQTTQVSLLAKLTNMAVTVEYSEAFEWYCKDYSVVISRGGTELADFSTQPKGSIAFIKPQAFKVAVSFTYQDGSDGVKTFDVTENVAACTWQKIRLDVNNGTTGNGSVTIIWNDDVEIVPVAPIETGEEEEEEEINP